MPSRRAAKINAAPKTQVSAADVTEKGQGKRQGRRVRFCIFFSWLISFPPFFPPFPFLNSLFVFRYRLHSLGGDVLKKRKNEGWKRKEKRRTEKENKIKTKEGNEKKTKEGNEKKRKEEKENEKTKDGKGKKTKEKEKEKRRGGFPRFPRISSVFIDAAHLSLRCRMWSQLPKGSIFPLFQPLFLRYK